MKHTIMLKKNYEFRLVLNKGKYYAGKYIEAFCIKNNFKCNKIRNSYKKQNAEKQLKEIELKDL